MARSRIRMVGCFTLFPPCLNVTSLGSQNGNIDQSLCCQKGYLLPDIKGGDRAKLIARRWLFLGGLLVLGVYDGGVLHG